jgi:hypothetical protein
VAITFVQPSLIEGIEDTSSEDIVGKDFNVRRPSQHTTLRMRNLPVCADVVQEVEALCDELLQNYDPPENRAHKQLRVSWRISKAESCGTLTPMVVIMCACLFSLMTEGFWLTEAIYSVVTSVLFVVMVWI